MKKIGMYKTYETDLYVGNRQCLVMNGQSHGTPNEELNTNTRKTYRPRALTQSHLKPKVTVRQFSGYRKIKSIYVKTMLLFKVIGGMEIILNSYCLKRYAIDRI